MKKKSTKRERLPRVAVVGLFQGGKSLLINAALGGVVVPVGRLGLRTTPCKIRCRYGEINRAVVHQDGYDPRGFSIRALSAYVTELDHSEHLTSVDFFHSHPILRRIELFDTPGIDFSESDNEIAMAAAKEADAVVLVAQQSLPAGSSSFDKLSECLQGKPWGLLLNCGRAGSHLENSDSSASIEVEEHILRQLHERGTHEPVFSQRMSAHTLAYYASEQFDATKTARFSEEHQQHLKADEQSICMWRENLLLLGNNWLNECLERTRQRMLNELREQGWADPKVKFDTELKRFECRVGYDGVHFKVRGSFRIESMARYDRLVLDDFKCSEDSVIEWLQASPEWSTWKFK